MMIDLLMVVVDQQLGQRMLRRKDHRMTLFDGDELGVAETPDETQHAVMVKEDLFATKRAFLKNTALQHPMLCRFWQTAQLVDLLGVAFCLGLSDHVRLDFF